jgi:hypothetical protein
VGPKTEQIWRGPFLETFQRVLGVVKDRTAIGFRPLLNRSSEHADQVPQRQDLCLGSGSLTEG